MPNRHYRRLRWAVPGLALAVASGASITAHGADSGKITVGIAGANYAIESARAMYESVAAGLEARGIAVKFLDAQLDINKQVSQIDQFVDEGVNGIVLNVAGDPNAVIGPLNRAKKAGVKVFGLGGIPGFDSTLVEADLPSDELGRGSGDYMCKATGGTGQIALIEAIDIPTLAGRWNTFLSTIKATCPSLKVVAVERAIPDDAATARPIAEDLLTRFPDLKAIWTSGDGPALGTGLAAKSAGRDIIVTGLNGESSGIDGVKQGVVTATWDFLPTDIGTQLATRVADILQGKVPVPTKTEAFTVEHVPEWNKATVAAWKPYEGRVKYPGLQ